MWGVLGLPTPLSTWNAGKLPLPCVGVVLRFVKSNELERSQQRLCFSDRCLSRITAALGFSGKLACSLVLQQRQVLPRNSQLFGSFLLMCFVQSYLCYEEGGVERKKRRLALSQLGGLMICILCGQQPSSSQWREQNQVAKMILGICDSFLRLLLSQAMRVFSGEATVLVGQIFGQLCTFDF